MRFFLPLISCLALSSSFVTVNASASAPLSDRSGQAENAQAVSSKKRVSIHLESYADPKSAAAAQEIAALIETKLPKGSIDHSRHVDKSTAKRLPSSKEMLKQE